MGFLHRIADCRINRAMVLQGGAWNYGGAQLTLNLTLISKEILSQTNCKPSTCGTTSSKTSPSRSCACPT